MARSDPQVNIRMPQALKDRLEEVTTETKRSLNGEIIDRLVASFNPSNSDGLTDVIKQQSKTISMEQRRRKRELRVMLDALEGAVAMLKKSVEVAEKAGLSGKAFDDLYNEVGEHEANMFSLESKIDFDDAWLGRLGHGSSLTEEDEADLDEIAPYRKYSGESSKD